MIFVWFNPLQGQTEFEDFPWLSEVIDSNDCCQNQTITAYQSGIFTFVYIEKGAACEDEGSELYFQDGTFYCIDINGMDCRAAYNLTEDNATTLWDCRVSFDQTFTICAGDSIFLPAIQEFPRPPLPPVGPNGEIPPLFCIPPLTGIEISPADNALANGLAGFYVSPTQSTFYEVKSTATCDGPDLPYSSGGSVFYQVNVQDEDCETNIPTNCEGVLEQEWLAPLLAEDCTGKIYQITCQGQPAVYISTLCACVDATDMVFSCAGEALCSNGFANATSNCDETVTEQLTEENLIWQPDCDCECPVDFTPVCGADGNTYESACEATCNGVDIVGQGDDCSPSACPAFDNLNLGNPCEQCISEIATYSFQGETYLVTFGDNQACSDAITTVMHCDSTVVFCFEGGIAGFNQCETFFEEAERTETIWSKAVDCGPSYLDNCLPLDNITLDENLCESCVSEVAVYEFKGEFFLVTREDNPICSDGITTVTNCNATDPFCLEGGFADFNQCTDFFAGATLVEILWSSQEDCDNGGENIKIAEPCTDLAGIDFGLCEAVMGVAIVEGQCTTVSGCLNFEIDGVDYTKAFFPTVEICAQTCGGSTPAERPEIFGEFLWLTDVVDLDNCDGTVVEFYDTDTHFFIHIQTADKGQLYFEDGTFYCQDQDNYNCRALYGLTEKQLYETWVCVDDGVGFQIPDQSFQNNFTNSDQTTSLKAFPNPTTDFVQLQLPTTDNAPQDVIVYDLYGRIVQKMVLTSDTAQLDLSSEDAGIYIVEWSNGVERATTKVIKKGL